MQDGEIAGTFPIPINYRLAEHPLPSPGERVARHKPGRVWDSVHLKFILGLLLCGIFQIFARHPSSVSPLASHLPPGGRHGPGSHHQLNENLPVYRIERAQGMLDVRQG